MGCISYRVQELRVHQHTVHVGRAPIPTACKESCQGQLCQELAEIARSSCSSALQEQNLSLFDQRAHSWHFCPRAQGNGPSGATEAGCAKNGPGKGASVIGDKRWGDGVARVWGRGRSPLRRFANTWVCAPLVPSSGIRIRRLPSALCAVIRETPPALCPYEEGTR